MSRMIVIIKRMPRGGNEANGSCVIVVDDLTDEGADKTSVDEWLDFFHDYLNIKLEEAVVDEANELTLNELLDLYDEYGNLNVEMVKVAPETAMKKRKAQKKKSQWARGGGRIKLEAGGRSILEARSCELK
eukprot:GFUD01126200.1.p1 GENE.GFUD01126200.1~~GFUD01126200.1.p1  ORF type:complete len:131 (+),score=36.58 GFUD01126200.1:96-488(+)